MIRMAAQELRRLLPLLITLFLLMALAAGLLGYQQYVVRGGPALELEPAEEQSRIENNLYEVQRRLTEFEDMARHDSSVNDKFARTIHFYRYLLQRGIPEEYDNSLNLGKLLAGTATSLPYLLAIPAALLGGLLATRRVPAGADRQGTALSRLLALFCAIMLLSLALLLLVLLLGNVLLGGAGLDYPQIVSSPFGVGYRAFLILARWQVAILFCGYAVFTSLTLAAISAVISLLCGHWLAGLLLVGGAALSSLQLSWLTNLLGFLDADAVWLQAISRGQLFDALLWPTSICIISLGLAAWLFPQPTEGENSQGRLLTRRLVLRLFRSVRWRFILLFIVSGLLAAVGVFITLGLALTLYRFGILAEVFERLYGLARWSPAIAYGVLLFVVFYFILTSRITVYLEEISLAVGRIASGDWSVEIPKRYNDELGELATNINRMAKQMISSREEERRAEQAKTELITSVSHDLRTPLTSVLGYLELIVQSDPENNAEWQRYAAIARGKAQRLQRLIDGLFEYTRLAYGDLQIDRRAISLDSLLRQLSEEFVPILQQANMEQELLLPAERVTVLADGDLLVRVFDNLYSNAVRYSQAAGKMQVTLTKQAEQAVVEVVNFGLPIPEEDLPHVFERLYRADKARSAQAGGTGLGLAIAKQIVELHEGSIAAESNEQRTVFTVRLPLAPTNGDSQGNSKDTHRLIENE